MASVSLASSNNLPINNEEENDVVNFYSLQYALFITIFVELLGAIFFFITAFHVVKDKELAETETPGWPSYSPIVN